MLELRHISKRFGDREILSDISLNINQGEIVSILGPSGCGKTTLLNLILGLTDLTEGQLIYDGEDLSHVSMKDRGFNIVFQDFALFPNLNARENILYGLRNNPNASTKQEVEDLIDLLGLRKHLEQRIEFSNLAYCCLTSRFRLWTASSKSLLKNVSARSLASISSQHSS